MGSIGHNTVEDKGGRERMSVEDRVVNLETAFLELSRMAKRADERIDTIGESIGLLTQLVARHDARFDHVGGELSNADARIAALADAQIRTEDALGRLEAQLGRTDEQLNRLADIVERFINNKGL